MSVRANPMENLPKPMAKIVKHLQNGKTIRLDKTNRTWTYYCGKFARSEPGVIGMGNSRFPVLHQTFSSLQNRGLIEVMPDRVTPNCQYYRLKRKFMEV